MSESAADNPFIKPCTSLKKVGPQLSQKLAKCGIQKVRDLLFYLPYRYQDRTRITAIAGLRLGDHAVIEGCVQSSHYQPGRKGSFLCSLSDGTGVISLRFFHIHPNQAQRLVQGCRLRCFGEVRHYGHLEMVHPEYSFLDGVEAMAVAEHLTPIYHTTAGVSQHILRHIVSQALSFLDDEQQLNAYLPECLPQAVREQHQLMPLAQAIRFAHQPAPDADVYLLEQVQHPAQRRLVFEELLAQQLSMQHVRAQIKNLQAQAFAVKGELEQQLRSKLPFALTQAQSRVFSEIKNDLATQHPMLRLLQGDVGAGKTVVAALAACVVVEGGCQVALMAPTEILAEQHFQTLQQWFSHLDINVCYLSGKSKVAERRATLQALASFDAHIAVGTHALFQKEVEFADLGLVIIDEQHRFGVHQRLALRDKGKAAVTPHQLIMTATPIPRTLAMTAYADLDVSIIDELPPGRTPITTVAIANQRRSEVIERINKACLAKRQVYWVCTLIEESDVLQAQAAEATAELLTSELSNLRVGLVHGRLKSSEKEAIMSDFKSGALDLLVATTVIEVGVDVPNATLMVIENPERLGLAQLHQLRGRVGRGSQQSYCVLLYQAPLSQHGRQRLKVMRDTTDGFEIARYDLQLRGPGEVLGTRQTGITQLRVADIQRDQALLPQVQQLAAHLVEHDPDTVIELMDRWLADGLRYGGV